MQIRLSNFGPVANCTENRTQGWTVLKIKCSDLYLLILNTNGFACMGDSKTEDIGIMVCIGGGVVVDTERQDLKSTIREMK